MEQPSSELIAILGVGAAMLGVKIAIIWVVLQQSRRLERRIDALALRMDEHYCHLTDQMNDQFRQVNEQMDEQFRQMSEQFRKSSERAARVEGKFDLLETFVEHRKEPSTEAAE